MWKESFFLFRFPSPFFFPSLSPQKENEKGTRHKLTHPLDRFDSWSTITTASSTGPNRSK